MARDSQRSKVYAWERVAYPGMFTERKLTALEARQLVQRVHQDVIAIGGFADANPVVKFTKRAGGACASWGNLNFTRGSITIDLVLHEVAHSLTWNPSVLRLADAFTTSPLGKHALAFFCDQGHGPRWVACFIALQERYNGRNVEAALQTAHFFRYQGWGPWKTVNTRLSIGGRKIYDRVRTKEIKFGSIKVSAAALEYWRLLLGNSPASTSTSE